MALGRGIRIPIDVDSSGAVAGIKRVDNSIDRMSKGGTRGMNLLKGAALGAGAAIGAGLTAVITSGVTEMVEWEKAAARTANVIETTGGKAGVTAKHVENLANRLQSLTGTEDDVIASTANVVLTFDKISAKGGVFDRTVALANDMSVAMGTDAEGAARKLGRALQDPEKGLGALTRAGVVFDKQQKEQIKNWIAHGDIAKAQTFILEQVERRFKGAASAEGETTEAVQRLQRGWEEFTQTVVEKAIPVIKEIVKWIQVNLAPAIRDFVAEARRFWARFGNDIEAAVNFALQHFGRIVRTLANVLRLVSALLRGDWREAWNAAKAIVRDLVQDIIAQITALPRALAGPAKRAGQAVLNGIKSGLGSAASIIRSFASSLVSAIRGLASAVFAAAKGIGDEIIDGIVAGIQAAAGSLGSAVRDAVSAAGRGIVGTLNPFRQMGGTVPGRYGSAVPIIAHAGEVVLNPRQQKELGVTRIMDVLRRTGGKVGEPGDSMASGGILDNAIAFARAQVGEPYLWGGGHQGYGDFSAWDCSGFASNVAAHVPGYTGGIRVVSGFAGGKAAGASDPVVFGLRSNLGHMGIRLMGTWYDAGSGGVQVGDSRWDQLVIPPGLENLSASAGLTSADGPDTGAPEHRELTPLQKVTALIKKSGAFTAKATGPLARSILAKTPDLSSGDLPSFTGAQTRQVSAAGRAARHKARVAGKSPEQVTEAGEDAEREAERKVLRRYVKLAKADLKRLSKLKAELLKAFQKLGRTKPKNAAGRAAKQKLMAQMRIKLAELTEEINDVRSELAEINARRAELLEEEEIEAYEDAYDAAHPDGEGGTGTAETTTPEAAAVAGPTADQQAQIDQANQRAAVAARGQAISDAFLRTLFGSGTIDPNAGFVTVNINTLHPGDPQIQGEVAQWVVGALGGQGSVPRSAYSVGV